jgi:hypothetical protein
MGKELEEANLRELAQEIRAMGLPESVVADLEKRAWENRSSDLVVYFDAQMEGLPVKGMLSLEREPAFDLLKTDYLRVDLGENTVAKYKDHFFDLNSTDELTLREAVNLMEGRPVYRPDTTDPGANGYWLLLDGKAADKTFQLPDILASRFVPERVIRESPLAQHLDGPAQEKLAAQLARGDRVEVEVGPPERTRTIYVQVDLLPERLRVTNSEGQELGTDELARSLGVEHAGLGHGRGR